MADLEAGGLAADWRPAGSGWSFSHSVVARLGASNSEEDDTVTKLEAIIQPRKLDAVKAALLEVGVEGMTISDVRGHGRQKGHTEHYRGGEYTVDLLPKVKVEIVLPDDHVEDAVNAILSSAATGQIGDGKIFLVKVEEAIRIRNRDRGAAAL
jgi:nitrogen regulatory protein P-II 1